MGSEVRLQPPYTPASDRPLLPEKPARAAEDAAPRPATPPVARLPLRAAPFLPAPARAGPAPHHSRAPAGAQAMSILSGQPRGFVNHGETCHLNACLTALSSSRIFRKWFSRLPHDANGVWRHFDRPLRSADNSPFFPERAALDPARVLVALSTANFPAARAQDAHETFGRIVTVLESLAGPPAAPASPLAVSITGAIDADVSVGGSPVGGLVISRTQCTACNARPALRVDRTECLSLVASQRDQKLTDAIADFFGEEEVELTCGACKATTMHRRRRHMSRMPAVLALHLQRGVYDAGRVVTTRCAVDVPDLLSVPAWRRKHPAKYVLRAAIHHHGSGERRLAHYTAAVRRPAVPAAGLLGALAGSWWYVNDARVTRCKREIAVNPRSVYMLVYDRV